MSELQTFSTLSFSSLYGTLITYSYKAHKWGYVIKVLQQDMKYPQAYYRCLRYGYNNHQTPHYSKSQLKTYCNLLQSGNPVAIGKHLSLLPLMLILGKMPKRYFLIFYHSEVTPVSAFTEVWAKTGAIPGQLTMIIKSQRSLIIPIIIPSGS